ncbi:hypothetical protein BDV28DRAFT_135243 [Aspergillus coremiiformis]|uniref:Secreted protein n=1 Tax=Aspergillus coremiiformis TaxID=138285 RepID=A0A5N6Z3X0_9EURO|nr:hypothetical protein BDV28DRAFT_135243 [Aspergillus coremiiformis]
MLFLAMLSGSCVLDSFSLPSRPPNAKKNSFVCLAAQTSQGRLIKRDTADYLNTNVACSETSRTRDTADATVALQVLAATTKSSFLFPVRTKLAL